MHKLHHSTKKFILAVIDFFYPWFKRLMPLQTFRYAVCGGSNTLLSILTYFISYNFIFDKEIFYGGFVTISPHIAAYILAFLITFPIGFYLSLFVVFPESYLKRRIQLFRYLVVVLLCNVFNYGFLKLFVEVIHWYPTPSFVLTTALVVTFSYFSQRHFSFKVKRSYN
jgi:putative flippase GtrA